MKKKILFVIDSLNIGGGEKSLVTLLNLLDYNKFEVDLQLFSCGGVFEQFLPKEVNMLPIVESHSKLMEIAFSIALRTKQRSHASLARIYWSTIGHTISNNKKKYDVAIAYAQCVPTFFVIDKVYAKKKYGWVNCIFNLKGREQKYNNKFYQKLDGIAVVSNEALKHFNQVYPNFSNKMFLLKDLYDGKMITRMSSLPSDKKIDRTKPVIMTVGRLNKPQKGYDLALKACKILKERGIDFKWYAVGEGAYRKEMENYIENNGLKDKFILLGASANPYSYIRQCDIYVQTSREEGFGLTVAEAKILNRPLVCTNFSACKMQIINEKNGLISSFEPSDIADKIQRLMTDKCLYENIQHYLVNEKKDNIEEIETFYKRIGL